ncbi:Rieske 2Fe-2S domain-containing protein [Burkholderia sp. BCC1988]|uniref:Rieske 2Fe-2S domain-containing protein n=1 Tax=Burkholderia sp. BCC1988 TaxID=2817443 RepID=UPI002AB10682|nr:Rieske 2Fe-2S domain-containing protein [Burkholderia sp. BCC1988]
MDAITRLAEQWPSPTNERIPYWAYHDPDIFGLEQNRIFEGNTWSFLGLEAEVPAAGDFIRKYVGTVCIIIQRSSAGEINAFVNRCAHRGAEVRREERGNSRFHTCCYHQWRYGENGKLLSVPFRHGVGGRGGLPSDFDCTDHSMRRLRVASVHGLIFGTFSWDFEALEEYLGDSILSHIARTMCRPIRILGYQRQRFFGNWKLYCDNLRDMNHGGLLHMFQISFGLARLSANGGTVMDRRKIHNLAFNDGLDHPDGTSHYKNSPRGEVIPSLERSEFMRFIPEFSDNYQVTTLAVFPNLVVHQVYNSLAVRQIRLVAVDRFDLIWTYFGYADDSAEMSNHRIVQGNLTGPAGYISMEDGEAIALTHRATSTACDDTSFVEIGGRGDIVNQNNLVTEVPMRGYWQYYRELMCGS